MDIGIIITGMAVLIGAVAGIVQIVDYLEKRRERKMSLQVSASRSRQSNSNRQELPQDLSSHRRDGDFPDVSAFRGRERDLSVLEKWIIADRCRLIGIFGMGGIGKTTFTAKLTEKLEDHFDVVIWRSLLNSPPIEDILGEWIQVLSNQQISSLPEVLERKVSLILDYLQQRRCLIILDNLETVMQEGDESGSFREGYEAYSLLIRRIGETVHQSCLLITSREKPKEFAQMHGENAPVRIVQLMGLETAESREILSDKGLSGSDDAWEELRRHYLGNPLALKLVSETIKGVFDGDIDTFLEEGDIIFGGVRELLKKQFDRLSQMEKVVVYWLAIEREWTSVDSLQENIIPRVSKGEILEGIVALQRRFLVERSGKGLLTLQPVVMEFATNQLIEEVYADIMGDAQDVITQYALIKAQAKDYIRNGQNRIILRPVIDRLVATLKQRELERKLSGVVSNLRSDSPYKPGYTVGNVLNIMVEMKSTLSGYDFSKLSILQAYLQDADLRDTNFAYSDFSKSAFTDTFGGILSAAFSPDGKLLVAGTTSGDIRLWAADGDKHLHTFEDNTNYVRTVAFSSDGKLIASGGDEIRIWDLNSGQCLHVLTGHIEGIRSVSFGPDSNLLASGSMDHTIKLWDLSTNQCISTLHGHEGPVTSVSFAFNGSVLVSGSLDRTLRLWDIITKKCITILEGHSDSVYSCAVSRDGKTLVSGSRDQTVKIWDLNTRKCIRTLEGHTYHVQSVDFSPNDEVVASGGDLSVRVWNVYSGECLQLLQGHVRPVRTVVFHPTAHTLVSGGHDGALKMWDINTGRCLRSIQGYTNPVWSVAFATHGNMLASGTGDSIVRLWDTRSNQGLRELKGHTGWVMTLSFSSDSSVLASGSTDRTIRLWDTTTNHCRMTLRGHESSVKSIDFKPGSEVLASGCEEPIVRLWNTKDGQCLGLLEGHTGSIDVVRFSPHGDLLATASADQTIRLWDINTDHCVKVLKGHNSSVKAIYFSPDGKTLASGGRDQIIRLWDINTGECVKSIRGHTGPIRAITFHPKESIFASGSGDQTVRLWDTNTDDCLKIFQGHTNLIRSIAFSSDGQLLASASDDGTIRLWDVLTGVCLRILIIDRPYERMNITGVTGITEAQKATLKDLGAFEEGDNLIM